MGDSEQDKREGKARITAAVIYSLAAAGIVRLLVVAPFMLRQPHEPLLQVAAITTPVVLLLACGLLWLRPRLGYAIGLAGGALGLLWLGWQEFWFGFGFRMANAWIDLNVVPQQEFSGWETFLFGKWKIIASALVMTAFLSSVLRLLPARWRVRGLPIRTRTWPALATCFVVVGAWYAAAVTPYRIPMIVDSSWPELTILRVEKHGLQFHEIAASVFRDGRFSISRNDRRLFQYRFPTQYTWGVVPPTVVARAQGMLRSQQLSSLPTGREDPLRRWNASGWYVSGGRLRLSFTSEDGTEPPTEIIGLFSEIEKTPTIGTYQGSVADVCLGFCYDPAAGMGFVFVNHRCRMGERETRCR